VLLASIGLIGATDDPAANALEQLRAQDARVAVIAFRLATANVDLCDDRGPQFGLVLHSARQYSPRLRPTVRRVLGAVDGVSIEAVTPAGPAAAAGLRPGDVIVEVGERRFGEATRDDDSPASYALVEQVWSALNRAGGVRVVVRRGEERLAAELTPQPGCAYDVQLTPSSAINASADGRHVFVTTGMAAYAANDDDLALVLGHELGHDVLHHREVLDSGGFARNLLGNLGASRADLVRAERDADYVGLYLTSRAGYDISGADTFWRRFAADQGDSWLLRWSHPSKASRAQALADTREEIERKRREGAPLIPDVERLQLAGSR
jgi:hypothetical protein